MKRIMKSLTVFMAFSMFAFGEDKLCGIGAKLSMEKGGVRVLEVFPESGADIAGLLAGTTITHVEGKPVRDLRLEEVVPLIQGEGGTSLEVTVEEPGLTQNLTIIRQPIVPPEKWSKEEQIKFYKKGLNAPNNFVQTRCISALKAFPEGYDILVNYAQQHPTKSTALSAVYALQTLDLTKEQGKDLFKIHNRMNDSENKQMKRFADRIVDVLAKKFPEEFNYIGLLRLVEQYQTRPRATSRNFEQVENLCSYIPQKHLYRLVPVLCDSMISVWDPYKERIHKLLVKITGKNVPYERSYSPTKLREVVEEYREYFYTELKKEIPPIDEKALTDPFAAREVKDNEE